MTKQDGGFNRAAFQRKIPVFEVRSAIHVRTGECAVVEALDHWLARHHVDVIPFADVYDACVHLIKDCEHIPDLALIGADWLADDEFNIVTYIRQTWPRTGIVVYGGARETPLVDLLPMMLTCRTEAALQQLLAGTPTDLVRRLWTDIAEPALPPAPRAIPTGKAVVEWPDTTDLA
jgi:hypothetical protein